MNISFKLRDFGRVFQASGASLILRMVTKTTKRALTGFGAYARAVARNSLGTGNAVSPPGQPPTSRTKMLKNSIRFGVDMARRSVVIGPVVLGVSKKVKGLVPPLLEYGGLTLLLTKKKGWSRASYRARPFMGPAFIKSLPQLDQIWKRARLG